MFAMVTDLLAYSRVVGESTDVPALVPVNEAVNAALVNLGETVISTGATIEVAAPASVRVHETHLVQLFQQLLANALKYRRCDVAPKIHISAARDVAQWRFCVSDNGIGFDPAYAEKIFGVFKRLHLRSEYPGNGIGLAICARIVGHYGGRIWAESQPSSGANFYFTLPAAEDCPQ
jgi:chemotaxis family two-component system sensor kinase Cph1